MVNADRARTKTTSLKNFEMKNTIPLITLTEDFRVGTNNVVDGLHRFYNQKNTSENQ